MQRWHHNAPTGAPQFCSGCDDYKDGGWRVPKPPGSNYRDVFLCYACCMELQDHLNRIMPPLDMVARPR